MSTTQNPVRPEAIADRRPDQIDAELFPLLDCEAWARRRAKESAQRLQRAMQAPEPGTITGPTPAALLEIMRTRLADNEAELARWSAAIAPLQAEFERRGGWARFYLVAGGHVHQGTGCSSCRSTTRFQLQTHLSGAERSAVVELHGDQACAICMPGVQLHPAFLKAQAARQAQEAQRAAIVCPRSRTYAKEAWDGKVRARRLACPECGERVAITRWGMFRLHDRPACSR